MVNRSRSHRAPTDRDILLARSAAGNHGIFTLAVTRAAGIPDSTVNDRVHRRIYERVLPGTYCFAGTPPSWHRDAAAALAWAGENSALSGASAATARGFHGFPRQSPIDISTVHARRSPTSWVRVRRVDGALDPEIEEFGGLYVASRRRMLLELAGDNHPRTEPTLDQCLREHPQDLRLLWNLLESPAYWGRRGIRILGDYVRARTPGVAPTDSDLEVMMLRILRRRKLPRPVGQYEVLLPFSPVHLDLAYPERLLGIECDSRGWHLNSKAFERDRQRDIELARLGWLVLRFTWSMMKFQPEWVADTVEHHFRTRPVVA